MALILDSHGQPHCSGVYVAVTPSQRVVLTAAHCLWSSRRLSGTVAVSFARVWSPGVLEWTGNYFVDPSYNPHTGVHDIAIVNLINQPPIEPAVMAATGSAAHRGIVDVVGYGQPYVGERRGATETAQAWDSSWLYLTVRSGNSCSGDSGGPDFRRGTQEVIALADLGSCTDDQDTRVDVDWAHRLAVAASTWDTHRQPMSANLSTPAGTAGRSATITGGTNSVFVGEPIVAEEKSLDGWHVVATGHVRRGGGYALTVTPKRRGAIAYRVVLPAGRTHVRAESESALLRVAH